jgi:hypothetical protein
MFVDNSLIKELSTVTNLDYKYVRKLMIAFYTHLINELLVKGQVSDYIFDMQLKTCEKTKSTKLFIKSFNKNFEKVLKTNIDEDIVLSIINELD